MLAYYIYGCAGTFITSLKDHSHGPAEYKNWEIMNNVIKNDVIY